MPRSGQTWDPSLLRDSALLQPFTSLLRPWFERSSWPSLLEYNQVAEAQRLKRAPTLGPLTFAPAAPKRSRARRDSVLDPARLYDGSIALRGQVPCVAESYHDLFNVLVWSAFPRAKRALHARQYQALRHWLPAGASRLPNRRTREQDALTVFDEGGSVVLVPAAQLASLQQLKERCRLEPDVGQFVLFGHALMEHVAYGRETVRSAALLLPAPTLTAESTLADAASIEALQASLFETIDLAVCARLTDPTQFDKPSADVVVEISEQGELWLSPNQHPAHSTPPATAPR